jgi:polyphenol oxidase
VLSLGSLGGGVRYAYTTRAGGFSAPPYDTLNLSLDVGDDAEAVGRNRKQLLDRLGVPAAVWLRARHGSDVAVVAEPAASPPEVDAVVTASTDLGLAALSADCALVVLADARAGVIAAVHCGRPGLLVGTLGAAVASMRAIGGVAIRAAVGPSICGSCYELPQAVAQEVVAAVPAAAARSRAGRPAVDVAAGVAAQLAELGVDVVRRVGGCTREDPALFSYRRDRVTGRQAVIVWRTT